MPVEHGRHRARHGEVLRRDDHRLPARAEQPRDQGRRERRVAGEHREDDGDVDTDDARADRADLVVAAEPEKTGKAMSTRIWLILRW